MVHFTGRNEVADLLRHAKTVPDKRKDCAALHESVVKGISKNNRKVVNIQLLVT